VTTVYIKPMEWVGKISFYVGLRPSNPQASPGHRLGGYFLVCRTIEEARAVARGEAARMQKLGYAYGPVVECPLYVGF